MPRSFRTCSVRGCTWRVSGTQKCKRHRAEDARNKGISRLRRRREGRCTECGEALDNESLVENKARCPECISASRQRWARFDETNQAVTRRKR